LAVLIKYTSTASVTLGAQEYTNSLEVVSGQCLNAGKIAYVWLPGRAEIFLFPLSSLLHLQAVLS